MQRKNKMNQLKRLISKGENALSKREVSFIESRDSLFMASVGADGWPYVQHRGGPRGFIKMINSNSFGFADYSGNRQYISVGNIQYSEKVCLILIDYPTQQRLKFWTTAKISDVNENPELFSKLSVPDYDAVIERLMTFKVQAFDWNCPQHITPRYTGEEISRGVNKKDHKISKYCRGNI
jgi:predicted pyridoxine 5'-phosphate oxidase superfamily flavin-nucleotide-binding protein